jgi:hypothetical protein
VTASFEKLVQAALLGTERQAPPAPSGETAAANLQQQVDASNRETCLLSMAALAGLHERAGSLPPQSDAIAMIPAPSETAPHASEHAGNALTRLLKAEFGPVSNDLRNEWFALAASANQLALAEALPLLLELGSTKPEIRESLLPVLGERGRWLAKQNSAWHWVHSVEGDEESAWHTGEPPERAAYLHRLRRIDPAKARELLGSTWKAESPEDRAKFLGTFEDGLSGADEDFLEQALGDKRKEVRAAASQLLVRIPNSNFLGHLKSAALKFLRLVPAGKGHLLKRAKSASIEIDLAAVEENTLPAASKVPKGIGEKAWVVIQHLELLPLTTWTDAWKLSAAELIEASLAGEWKNDLLDGWIRAAIQQSNAEWAGALFPAALAEDKNECLAGLLSVMHPQAAEARLAELLQAKDEKLRPLQGALLAQARHSWTPEFSRKVLDWLRNATAQESCDWQTRNNLVHFVPRFAQEVLNETKAGWPVKSKGWDYWRSGVDDLISAAQFRHEMIRALRDPN